MAHRRASLQGEAQFIPRELVVVGERQIRAKLPAVEELAEIIRGTRWVAPLQVRQRSDGKYDLIAGHRRFAATGLLHESDGSWSELPVQVVEADEARLLEVQAAENDGRRPANWLEWARHLDRYQSLTGAKQKDIAKTFGKSQTWVNHHLQSVRKIHPEILADIERELQTNAVKRFTLDEAVRISGLSTKEKQQAALLEWQGLHQAGQPQRKKQAPISFSKAQRLYRDAIEANATKRELAIIKHLMGAARNPFKES